MITNFFHTFQIRVGIESEAVFFSVLAVVVALLLVGLYLAVFKFQGDSERTQRGLHLTTLFIIWALVFVASGCSLSYDDYKTISPLLLLLYLWMGDPQKIRR